MKATKYFPKRGMTVEWNFAQDKLISKGMDNFLR